MLCLANKTTPMPLIYQPLPLAQAALLSMASQRVILVVGQSDDLPLGSAFLAPTIKSSKPSPLTSPALETDQPL
jgi:hypothetical protein